MLGVLRSVVFGGLRLLVSGRSARVRPRPGRGILVPSGVAYDCRVGLDPRGNIFDGLFPCWVRHGRGRVRSPGVALKDLRPGIVPAHAGSPDGGEDLVVLQMFGELL